jgi:hypothetical protein
MGGSWDFSFLFLLILISTFSTMKWTISVAESKGQKEVGGGKRKEEEVCLRRRSGGAGGRGDRRGGHGTIEDG